MGSGNLSHKGGTFKQKKEGYTPRVKGRTKEANLKLSQGAKLMDSAWPKVENFVVATFHVLQGERISEEQFLNLTKKGKRSVS